MLSVKDYATSRGISQVAVRKQLQRYQKELEGHIIQQSRRRMLDDDAVAFLDQHRMAREVIIEQADETAQKEIESLKAELDLARTKITILQDKIISLQSDQMELIRYQEQNKLLLEQKQENSQQMQKISEELSEVKNELGSFRKSWFGFWRKT